MSFRDSAASLIRTLNPLYNNPITVPPDANHLNVSRLMMGNPHVVTNAISKVLLNSKDFHHLANDMAKADPMFNTMLRTVITGDALYVNIHEIMSAPELVEGLSINTSQLRGRRIDLESPALRGHYHHHFYVSYASTGINGKPAIVVEGQSATVRAMTGYYDPNEPKYSLIVPLDIEARRLLGLR